MKFLPANLALDPLHLFLVAVFMAVVHGIGVGDIHLPSYVPSAVVLFIVESDKFIDSLWFYAIAPALPLLSSAKQGPFVSTEPVPVAKAPAALLLALGIGLGALLTAAHARAEPARLSASAMDVPAVAAAVKAAKAAPAKAAGNPFATLLQWTQADLQGAIAAANAATPPDADGATCYGALLAASNVIGNAPLAWPPHLVTDYERAWLLHASLAALKANSSCATVCGRAATMLAIYGVAVNNFCAALAKLP